MNVLSMAIAFAALGALYAAEPVAAQHYYNASCNCSHGGFGGAALVLGSGSGRSMLLQAPAEFDAMQMGVRNTMASQAQGRAEFINSQQQSTQDWYFQQQSLAMAQRRAAQYAKAQNAQTAEGDKTLSKNTPAARGRFTPTSIPAAVGANSTSSPTAPTTNRTDLIVWPAALKGEYFWSERKMIEDPYLRTPPKLSAPKPDDYREMAKAVENMKEILDRRMIEGMERREYDEGKSFLLKLQQEVSARISKPDGSK